MFGSSKQSGERRQPGQAKRQPVKSTTTNSKVFSYNSNRAAPEQRQGRDTTVARPKANTTGRKRLTDRQWVRNLPSLIALGVITMSVLFCLGLTTDPKIVVSANSPQSIVLRDKGEYQKGAQRILDRGTVIMMANDLSSSVRQTLPVVNDQSGISADVGKTILPADDIQFITTVLAQLKAKQVTAESITLPPTAQEVDMKLSGQPYLAKFNVHTDAREAAGAYLAVRQKLEQTKVNPAQYVDVRVPGRAYYQ